MENIKLIKISESEFNSANNKLFNLHWSRVFSKIIIKNKVYFIAWQSNLIMPVITKIGFDIFSIGVDLKFIIINIDNDSILIDLDLTYFFYDVCHYKNHAFIATELEIIVLDTKTFKINYSMDLPSFFEKFIITDKLIIKCIEGELIENSF